MRLSSSYRVFLFFCLAAVAVLTGCADRNGPPPMGKGMQEEEEKIEGTLSGYESNEAGDVEAMEVLQNEKTISVHFPPHTAEAIMGIAKPGFPIEATVVERKARPMKDGMGYELFSLTVKGKTISVHDIPPPQPQRGEETTISGKASNLVVGKKDEVRSFVINTTVIRLPPHVEMNLSESLRSAATVSVKGYKRSAGDGFVNSRGLDVVRPVSITVDSITYTIE